MNLGLLHITVEPHGAIDQHCSTCLSKLSDKRILYQNQIRQNLVRPGRKKLDTNTCMLTLSTLFVVQFLHFVFGFPWSQLNWGQIQACLVLQIRKKKRHLIDTHIY